ncbi:MAG: porin family protein [Bacteroidales bacterium]
MKRKITISLIVYFLLSGNLFAQKPVVQNLTDFDLAPYHFGFILGLNQLYFAVKPADRFMQVSYGPTLTPDINSDSSYIKGIESNPTSGFVIGIVSNLRLNKDFDLRFIPSLSFGEREMVYSFKVYNGNPAVAQNIGVTKKVQSTFVEFPLFVRYKGKRINNVRPYLLGGAKYTLDLASNSKKKDDTNNINVALEKNDLYGEIGVGFDFYTAWFKFGTEVKMAYGFRDMLKRDNTIYTSGVESLNSRIFQLSFSFE